MSISNYIHFKTIGTQKITAEFKCWNAGDAFKFQSQRNKVDEIHWVWLLFWKQITSYHYNIWLGWSIGIGINILKILVMKYISEQSEFKK